MKRIRRRKERWRNGICLIGNLSLSWLVAGSSSCYLGWLSSMPGFVGSLYFCRGLTLLVWLLQSLAFIHFHYSSIMCIAEERENDCTVGVLAFSRVLFAHHFKVCVCVCTCVKARANTRRRNSCVELVGQERLATFNGGPSITACCLQ